MTIHKKGQDDPGNYKPVSLTLILGNVMEQIVLSAITCCVVYKNGFTKGRSCSTNLISFYHKVTWLVDERKAVDFVYPDFSNALDTVSHSIVLRKPAV